jgi:hypothetical protein
MGEGAIESKAAAASIQVKLQRLEGVRLETGEDATTVKFDVDVKLEEQSRSGGELVLNFLLSISTKPSLVKFEAAGTATVKGGEKAFEAVLEVDPESNVPKVLHTIYQHAFTSLFLLSTMINSPYPPPDLLHSPMQTRDLPEEVPQEAAEARPEDQIAAEAAEQEAQQNPQQ